MAKSDGVVGICVRHNRIALGTLKGGTVNKVFWSDIPENIVDDNKVLSENLFVEFLKEKLKESGIRARKAAVVIADVDLFIKNVRMPNMSDEQLRLNIPFEFRDYVSGELKDYVFDYLKKGTSNDEETEKIDLLAYAVPSEYITGLSHSLRLAGLRLERAIPESLVGVSSWILRR